MQNVPLLFLGFYLASLINSETSLLLLFCLLHIPSLDGIRSVITLSVPSLIYWAKRLSLLGPLITIEQENPLAISLSSCPLDIIAARFLMEVM